MGNILSPGSLKLTTTSSADLLFPSQPDINVNTNPQTGTNIYKQREILFILKQDTIMVKRYQLSTYQVLCYCFGATLAVNGGGDYAAGVTCALTAGVEAFKTDVLEGFVITWYAYGR